jgi:hypothetical protein
VTAVLLAVAVLAVIGAVFGYVLGTRANDAAGPSTPSARVTPSDGSSPATRRSSVPAGKRCPEFIERAARDRGATLPFTLRLYILTNRSEVWICAEPDSSLWYQGHSLRNGPYPKETPVEGENGLLLNTVTATDGGRYVAVNRDGEGNETRYTVSRTELRVDRATNPFTENVIRVDS